MNQHKDDVYWMRQALDQAHAALVVAEVPVGAVMVYEGRCIAVGHNTSVSSVDPTAHAEVNVLRKAAQTLGNYRLNGCTLYVTLEPCAMCAMAMLHARIDRVVYGAADCKTGSAGSVVNLFAEPALNHQTEVTGGVLAQECAALLKVFFEQRRAKVKVPLRDDALRTPEVCFMPSVLSEGNYTHMLPSLNGLQLYYHQLPVNAKGNVSNARCVVLCLHDANAFSEQYADVVGVDVKNCVVLIPDLIGFGRSDKVKKAHWHSLEFHAVYLAELVNMYLDEGVLVIFSPVAFTGLAVLVQEMVKEKTNVLADIYLVEALPDIGQTIRNTPFPDDGHRVGPRVLGQWRGEGIRAGYKPLKCFTPEVFQGVLQQYVK